MKNSRASWLSEYSPDQFISADKQEAAILKVQENIDLDVLNKLSFLPIICFSPQEMRLCYLNDAGNRLLHHMSEPMLEKQLLTKILPHSFFYGASESDNYLQKISIGKMPNSASGKEAMVLVRTFAVDLFGSQGVGAILYPQSDVARALLTPMPYNKAMRSTKISALVLDALPIPLWVVGERYVSRYGQRQVVCRANKLARLELLGEDKFMEGVLWETYRKKISSLGEMLNLSMTKTNVIKLALSHPNLAIQESHYLMQSKQRWDEKDCMDKSLVGTQLEVVQPSGAYKPQDVCLPGVALPNPHAADSVVEYKRVELPLLFESQEDLSSDNRSDNLSLGSWTTTSSRASSPPSPLPLAVTTMPMQPPSRPPSPASMPELSTTRSATPIPRAFTYTNIAKLYSSAGSPSGAQNHSQARRRGYAMQKLTARKPLLKIPTPPSYSPKQLLRASSRLSPRLTHRRVHTYPNAYIDKKLKQLTQLYHERHDLKAEKKLLKAKIELRSALLKRVKTQRNDLQRQFLFAIEQQQLYHDQLVEYLAKYTRMCAFFIDTNERRSSENLGTVLANAAIDDVVSTAFSFGELPKYDVPEFILQRSAAVMLNDVSPFKALADYDAKSKGENFVMPTVESASIEEKIKITARSIHKSKGEIAKLNCKLKRVDDQLKSERKDQFAELETKLVKLEKNIDKLKDEIRSVYKDHNGKLQTMKQRYIRFTEKAAQPPQSPSLGVASVLHKQTIFSERDDRSDSVAFPQEFAVCHSKENLSFSARS